MKKIIDQLLSFVFRKNKNSSMSDSITYFNKSMQDKDKSELIRIQGNARYNKGDYIGAIKKYDLALSLFADSVEAYVDKAKALYKAGEFKQAMVHFDVAIKKNSNSSCIFEERAEILKLEGKTIEAEKDLKQVEYLKIAKLKDDTKKLETKEDYLARANEKLDRGEMEESLKDFNNVLEIDSENIDAYLNRAAIKRVLGDMNGASQDTEKVKQLQENKELRG